MQAVTDAYLASWRESGVRLHRVLVDASDGAGWVEVAATSFTVAAARGDRVVARYSGSVVFPAGAPPIDPYRSTVRCQSGFVTANGPQWVTIATMRVEDATSDYDGSQTITAYSAEHAVELAGFESPAVFASGSGYAAIKAILAVIALPTNVPATGDASVPQSVFSSSTSRWDAVQYYATALSVDVFCNPLGEFVIGPKPTLNDPPVLTIDAANVKLGHSLKRTRVGVPSVVVVEGIRTGDGTDGPRGIAYDDNPFSPTYYLGPFGRQQTTVSSPIMVTGAMCAKAARTILAQAQGLAKSLTVDTIPADFLLPGDVVTIGYADGSEGLHIVDSLAHSSADSPQQITTRTTGGTAAMRS